MKPGASLDYDTKSTYTGEVRWTVQRQAAVVNLTINVVQGTVGQPGTPTVTRKTSSGPIIPALDVSWTAAMVNGPTITGYEAKYRIKADEGEDPNRWTAYTGTLSRHEATSLVLSTLPEGVTYEVQVRAVTRPRERREQGAVVGHGLRAGEPAAGAHRFRVHRTWKSPPAHPSSTGRRDNRRRRCSSRTWTATR